MDILISDVEQPYDDISEYVSIDVINGLVEVSVTDNHKGDRSVQNYVTSLRTKYPGKVNIKFTTMDVIASHNEKKEININSGKSELNANQRKVLSYIATVERMGASDLHITPGRDSSDFTYVETRVHGELEVIDVIKRDEGFELLGTAYAMSDVMKGTQFDAKVPQDARIAETYLKHAGVFAVRYSHYPCVGGLYAVMRLIKNDSDNIPTFEQLGYLPEQTQLIRKTLTRPEGIVMLSGPTGAGKSTTLRTAADAYLSQYGFNDNSSGILLPRKRLLTIESPPEGKIGGAIQTAVTDTPAAWVEAIKAAMRLDPDGILNGEIRDNSSAIAAIKAAMTGHLMLTTVHANDAINIIERLEMEGVQARLIADPLLFIGLMSQRLVQKLCPHCKQKYDVARAKLTDENKKLVETYCNADDVFLRNYDGCDSCHRGVTGRTVIAEVIAPDATFFRLYRKEGRVEAKTYWHRELGGITRNQHLLRLVNSGTVDPLTAHPVSPIDEDSYSLLSSS